MGALDSLKGVLPAFRGGSWPHVSRSCPIVLLPVVGGEAEKGVRGLEGARDFTQTFGPVTAKVG